MLLRDLLDVDAAHVAEDDHGPAGGGVPGDGGVVLLLDRAALLYEHAHRLLPVDLDAEDRLGGRGGFLGRVGEAHAAGLHPPAAEHLRLEHDGPAELARGAGRLGGVEGDAALRQRHAVPRQQVLRLVLVEAHWPLLRFRLASTRTMPRRGLRGQG